MSEQKTSAMSGLAATYLLVIGIVMLVIGVLVWGSGGMPLIPFTIGAVLVIAWLIIKAAKS
jgi:hypothetical protein